MRLRGTNQMVSENSWTSAWLRAAVGMARHGRTARAVKKPAGVGALCWWGGRWTAGACCQQATDSLLESGKPFLAEGVPPRQKSYVPTRHHGACTLAERGGGAYQLGARRLAYRTVPQEGIVVCGRFETACFCSRLHAWNKSLCINGVETRGFWIIKVGMIAAIRSRNILLSKDISCGKWT